MLGRRSLLKSLAALSGIPLLGNEASTAAGRPPVPKEPIRAHRDFWHLPFPVGSTYFDGRTPSLDEGRVCEGLEYFRPEQGLNVRIVRNMGGEDLLPGRCIAFVDGHCLHVRYARNGDKSFAVVDPKLTKPVRPADMFYAVVKGWVPLGLMLSR